MTQTIQQWLIAFYAKLIAGLNIINSSDVVINPATEENQDTSNTSLAIIAGDTTSIDSKIIACGNVDIQDKKTITVLTNGTGE